MTQFLTYQGETLPIDTWAERVGMSGDVLRMRLACGWEPERILTQPVRSRAANRDYGQSKSIVALAAESGLTPRLIQDRLASGWSIEDATTIPSRKKAQRSTSCAT